MANWKNNIKAILHHDQWVLKYGDLYWDGEDSFVDDIDEAYWSETELEALAFIKYISDEHEIEINSVPNTIDGANCWVNSHGEQVQINSMPIEYVNNTIALIERTLQRINDTIAVTQYVRTTVDEDVADEMLETIESNQYYAKQLTEVLAKLQKRAKALSR